MSEIASLLTPNARIIGDNLTLRALLEGKQDSSPNLIALAALSGNGLAQRNIDGSWELVVGGGGATALNDLTDVTLASPVDTQLLRYNSGIWSNWTPDFASSSHSHTFLSLTDTPSSFASQSLKAVRVNAGETGLEFFTISGGGDAYVSAPLSQFAPTTSAQLAGVISDETGTGALVFATSPVLVTPTLGVASATSVNKVAITAPATSATLTIVDGATLTASATASVSGTNTGDNAVNSLYSGLVTNANHTGDATGATVLTLATVNSNVGSFGSATQSAAFTVNGKGLITAASQSTITPAVGSITGFGTGVGAALAIAVGTAGSFITNGGALGTPSGGTLTNATGLPIVGGTTGTLTVARGGTNRTALGSALQVLRTNAGATDTEWATATTGTVTSITLTQPAAGLTITGSGVAITTTGTPTFALANDLAAVEGLATTGIVRRTGADTWSAGTAVSLTTEVSGILPGANGGTANGFFAVSGPATTLKTFTYPNASATVLTDNAAVTVAQGGTGRQTSTTAWGLLAAGTTATGAHQTLATGATTDILVSGGASALPVWTTATGSGAPVRATSPTLVTPVLGAATATSLATTAGTVLARAAATQDAVILQGRAGGTTSLAVTLTPATLTSSRTLTLPDAAGTVALTSTVLALTGGTLTGSLILPAGTTSVVPLRIPHGSAPTTPTNGDMWTTTSGVFAQVNGSTVGPFGAGGASNLDGLSDVIITSVATGQMLFYNGSSWVNSSNLTTSATATTSVGTIVAPAATTSIASLRAPHGTAPSSPTNGDLWTTTLGLFARINGVTLPIFGQEHPGYFAGTWYQMVKGNLGPGSALVTNSMRFIPFYCSSTATFSRFGARITTASSGNNIQLAIYAADSANPVPTGAPIAATANISTTTAGLIDVTKSGGGTFVLNRGWYYMAVNSNNSVVVMQTLTAAFPQMSWSQGGEFQASVSGGDSIGTNVLSLAQTFGTWPTLSGGGYTEENSTSGIGASCAIHLKVDGLRPVF